MSFRNISRAAGIIAAGTVASRLAGLLREVATAGVFGTTFVYDAFLLAFMIPNFFRGIVGEGALSPAFIPVVSEYLSTESGRKEAKKIVNIVFTFSLLATSCLCLLALAVSVAGAHLCPPESKSHWMFLLLRFTFPYLIFISLSALAMGILNAEKHFAAPAWAPIAVDAVWVAALFAICPLFGSSLEEKVFGLCAGVILGGLCQFLVQMPAVMARGYRLRIDVNFAHPAVRRMGRLLAPVIVAMAVGPINLLVDYSCANLLQPGMASGLWYATRVYQLPLGVCAISLATAALPWFADSAACGDTAGLRRQVCSSCGLLLVLLLPCAAAGIILRREIVSLLFQRGMFDDRSVSLTAAPLAMLCLGLVGYGLATLLTRAFHAYKDTATPARVGVFSIAVNAFLDIVLLRPLGTAGIALSTSLVGWTNFGLLLVLFQRRHSPLPLRRLRRLTTCALTATLFLSAALELCLRATGHWLLPARVAACTLIGAAVYLTSLGICRRMGFLHEEMPEGGNTPDGTI